MEEQNRAGDPQSGGPGDPSEGAIEDRADAQAQRVDVGQRYRIIVTAASGDQGLSYLARAPELPECQARAATRAEAVAQLEQQLGERLAELRADGVDAPPPVDLQSFDGQLSLKVSPDLHRELAFAARAADLELGALLSEIIARMAGGDGRERGRSTGHGRGPGGRRRRGNMDDRRYHGIMENRADFIEYVRQLERDGGSRGGSGSGRGGGGRGRR